MLVTCSKCNDTFDDEYVSTVCPHDGLFGLCRKCDYYICLNPEEHRPNSKTAIREVPMKQHKDRDPDEDYNLCEQKLSSILSL